jgi:AbrB family looped-hinge helix DNA binding protein
MEALMNGHVSKARIARDMFTRPAGATMREIIVATGGPHYNELKRIRARGYTVREVKEGNETRYFATAPGATSFDATVTSKGQVTLPKEIRERLGVRTGGKLRFAVEDGKRVVLSVRPSSILDLVGILPKPKRSATIEQMDEAIRQAAVDRYLRAVGKKK